MKHLSIAILFLIILAGLSPFVPVPVFHPEVAKAATVYYVSGATGNDAWPGTSTGSPFATIDHAASVATTAGDYVWIMAGTYNERVVVDGAGTSGNPITFRNYNNGKVVVDGTGLSVDWGDGGFYINNKDYIVVDGIQTYNWGGAYLATGGGFVVRSGADNCVIQNTYSGSCGASGIWVYQVSNCTVTNNELDNVCTLGSQECITFQTVTGGTISYNYIHDIPKSYVDAWTPTGGLPKEGIDLKVACSNIYVGHNEVSGCRHGVYVDGRPSASNITIDNNLLYDQYEYGIHLSSEAGTGRVLSYIYVTNNITYGQVYSGFRMSYDADSYNHIYVINNTFYQSDNYIAWIREPGGNITDLYVENNIFAGKTGYGVMFDSGYTSAQHHFENNLYTVPTYYGSNYQSGATGMVNPTSDFSLLSSSNAVDNGKTPSITVSTDYAGTARPQNGSYDIGAYEYTEGGGDQIAVLSDTSDATYVQHPGDAVLQKTGKYSLDTSGLGSGLVNQVTAYSRGAYGTPSGTATLRIAAYLSGTTSYGTEHTLSGTITQYNDIIAYPGASGTWTVTDIGNAQWWIILEHNTPGWTNGARCSQFYLLVSFGAASGTQHQVTRAIPTDTDSYVECSYDGATQYVAVNGGTTAQATAVTIFDNTSPLHVAEFDGQIDDLKIQDAGTSVLQLDFEPEDINTDTIADDSASNNDVTYSLASANSCSSIEIGTSKSTSEIIPTVTDLDAQEYLPESWREENERNIDRIGENNPFFPLVEIVAEYGVPYWLTWMIIYLFVLIGVMMWTLAHTNSHIALTAIAGLMVTLLFYAWDQLIPWGAVAFWVIAALVSVILERRQQV